MTHLPDCPKSDTGIKAWMNVPEPYCICDRLRSCRDRTLAEAKDAMGPLFKLKASGPYYGGVHDAITIIDTMKEKTDG